MTEIARIFIAGIESLFFYKNYEIVVRNQAADNDVSICSSEPKLFIRAKQHLKSTLIFIQEGENRYCITVWRHD